MILSRTMAFLAAFLFAAAPSQAQTGIMLPIYVNGQVNPSMAAFLAGLSPVLSRIPLWLPLRVQL